MVCIAALACTPAAADPTVTGDDDTDSYRGVGAVLLSRTWSGEPTERSRSATCHGCRWSFRSSCRTHGMGCSSGSWPSCPPGTARFDMLRSDSFSDPLRYRGTVCLGPGGPATPGHIAAVLRDTTVASLGPLRPRLLSAAAVQGQLTQVSVGVPARVTFPMVVAGVRVEVTAAGRFTWQWPERSAAASKGPVASHTWLSSGPVRVGVSAVWTATFSLDDLGPFPVEQTITQQGSIDLRVHRAQRVLVPSQPQA